MPAKRSDAIDITKLTEAQLQELVRTQTKLIEELESANAKLKSLLFGRKSERHAADHHPELPFEDEMPAPAVLPHANEAPDEESDHLEHKAKAKRRSRGTRRLPENLPRERVVIELTADERRCRCCNEEMRVIGEETTEILDYQPASFCIREIVRPKYACAVHEESGVCIAALPRRPIPKGMASARLIAHVLNAKYDDHLPLFRLARMFRSYGVDLSENTLGDWVKESAEILLGIVEAMHEELLQSDLLHADETRITVLGPGDGKSKSRKCWLWVYLEPGGNRLVRFTPGRGGGGPAHELAGFRGHFMIDGYEGYAPAIRAGDIVPLACWAHARRGFFDARDKDPELCGIALEVIRQLYSIEREAKEQDLSQEQRTHLRREKSLPLLESFHVWLTEVRDRNLPGGDVAKAVHYVLNRWEKLTRYAEDGRLPIDNNVAERVMRHVAVGRKNWMFAGSDAGAERAATIYSLVLTCRELGIAAHEYLTSVLQEMAEDPSRAAALTPKNWKRTKEKEAQAASAIASST